MDQIRPDPARDLLRRDDAPVAHHAALLVKDPGLGRQRRMRERLRGHLDFHPFTVSVEKRSFTLPPPALKISANPAAARARSMTLAPACALNFGTAASASAARSAMVTGWSGAALATLDAGVFFAAAAVF